MKIHSIALLFLALLSLCSCRVRDVRTTTLHVTPLNSSNDVARITQALQQLPDSNFSNDPTRSERSLKIEAIDFDKDLITIRYDSMKIGTKNLEYEISQAGFTTDTFPAAKKGTK